MLEKEKEEAGAEIAPHKLAQLKSKYFQKILDDLKSKRSDMFQVSIYDKIVEVDKVAKDIFKDVLENRQGLMAKGGKMEAYQFDQDLTISSKMIGENAINYEKEKARTALAKAGKSAAATSPSKAEKDQSAMAASTDPLKTEMTPLTSNRGEKKPATAAPSHSAARKRGGDDNQSLATSMRSDELATNGGPDSHAKAKSGKEPKATLQAVETSSKG
jgi:hypothetical protein